MKVSEEYFSKLNIGILFVLDFSIILSCTYSVLSFVDIGCVLNYMRWNE